MLFCIQKKINIEVEAYGRHRLVWQVLNKMAEDEIERVFEDVLENLIQEGREII